MGRPRTPRLSRDSIALAAIELYEESGVLRIALLAERLGVAMSSLYNHVQGRDGIIDAIREYLLDQIGEDARRATWQETIRAMLTLTHSAYVTHPKLLPLLFANPVRSPALRVFYDSFFAGLLDDGVPQSLVYPIFRLIEAEALGLAVGLTLPDDLEGGLPATQRALSGIEVQEPAVVDFAGQVLVAGIEAILRQ